MSFLKSIAHGLLSKTSLTRDIGTALLGPKDYSNFTPPVDKIGTSGTVFDRDTFDNIYKPILYGEISNRPFDKQQLEANVILSTVVNRIAEHGRKNKKFANFQSTLTQPNAYQAYKGKQYNAYLGGNLNVLDTQKKVTIDKIAEEQWNQLSQGKFNDITEGAYYYVHDEKTGKIQYNNKKPLYE